MAGVTLDAGVLIAADRGDQRLGPWWEFVLRRRLVVTVPSAVLAQAWRDRSRQVRLARFLQACWVEPLTIDLAREAGELCGRAGTDDVIDASVVASAARRDDVVVTTDPRDLERLAEHVEGVVVRHLGSL